MWDKAQGSFDAPHWHVKHLYMLLCCRVLWVIKEQEQGAGVILWDCSELLSIWSIKGLEFMATPPIYTFLQCPKKVPRAGGVLIFSTTLTSKTSMGQHGMALVHLWSLKFIAVDVSINTLQMSNSKIWRKFLQVEGKFHEAVKHWRICMSWFTFRSVNFWC